MKNLLTVIASLLVLLYAGPVMAAEQTSDEDISCSTVYDPVLCKDVPVDCKCNLVGPLSIESDTGEDVNEGTVLTASGGRAPYTFTFGGGSLEEVDDGNPDTNDGNAVKVASISSCSTGQQRWTTVTVTDACGSPPASMEVRLPGGTWVAISDNSGSDGYFNFYTDNTNCSHYFSTCNTTAVEVSGGDMYSDSWARVSKKSYASNPCVVTCVNSPNTAYNTAPGCESLSGDMCVQRQIVYEWKCLAE